ncbi:hypothetical protein BD324DRAFT_627563 [Kockovaella imperatae]|uniref:Uncharacterized protein n=1 Tax=Kockovaella imperatae TaxID=4999 RepID=A0A1Y1UFY4_9TREE|nr:hypothetical protein BD324DRAFT_627563 [Kockovaella imperatae]ORX36889.1 hypothetical protein BD324DRAFT_627563 [Kockovaella imperatae]
MVLHSLASSESIAFKHASILHIETSHIAMNTNEKSTLLPLSRETAGDSTEAQSFVSRWSSRVPRWAKIAMTGGAVLCATGLACSLWSTSPLPTEGTTPCKSELTTEERDDCLDRRLALRDSYSLCIGSGLRSGSKSAYESCKKFSDQLENLKCHHECD